MVQIQITQNTGINNNNDVSINQAQNVQSDSAYAPSYIDDIINNLLKREDDGERLSIAPRIILHLTPSKHVGAPGTGKTDLAEVCFWN